MSDTAQDARSAAVALRLEWVPALYRTVYSRAASGTASPRQAIKAKCLDCCAQQRREVAECTVLACPLWLYRPYQSAEDPE